MLTSSLSREPRSQFDAFTGGAGFPTALERVQQVRDVNRDLVTYVGRASRSPPGRTARSHGPVARPTGPAPQQRRTRLVVQQAVPYVEDLVGLSRLKVMRPVTERGLALLKMINIWALDHPQDRDNSV